MPWVREAQARLATSRTRLYVDGGAGRTGLAEVPRSAMGTRDDPGDFRALASDSALSEVGIGFPPYHGLCRSTTLAVVCFAMTCPLRAKSAALPLRRPTHARDQAARARDDRPDHRGRDASIGAREVSV